MNLNMPARAAPPRPDPPDGGTTAGAQTRFQRPFLKWAGGKFRLLGHLLATLPPGTRLVEPFVGSGAVFLNAGIAANHAADANAHLIGTFVRVQEDAEGVLAEAQRLFAPANNSADAYYRLRDEFNGDLRPTARRAALFIYLNRHCFNGLCRFNRRGAFNVPFGRYRRPGLPVEEVRAFRHVAQRTTFQTATFTATMAACRAGDVVYCDPPYVPLTATADFTGYTGIDFGEEQQRALAAAARELAGRGVPVVISNHDTRLPGNSTVERAANSFRCRASSVATAATGLPPRK